MGCDSRHKERKPGLQSCRRALLLVLAAAVAALAGWCLCSPSSRKAIVLLGLAGSLAALALDYRRQCREQRRRRQ
ncbi:MAG: hypothetical protein K2O63_03150 [Alistipes sp.]|nr:hypothetical protein [Alistipes sp.]